MIELKRDQLTFSFPEVHPRAKLTIEFQRTLRIPDDDQASPLPPGLGNFPLQHVDNHAANVPSTWLQRGGVMLPMFQSEAMWLNLGSVTIANRRVPYPFAIKIATGKQCAVSGKAWTEGLQQDPQNYVVAPKQPWLDGYVVAKGLIRQFVAMPLGAGYTVEEQLTGKAEHGGLQIAVYPMKREVFERRFPKRRMSRSRPFDSGKIYSHPPFAHPAAGLDMGLAPGGQMRQEVYDDPYDADDWQLDVTSRCFVHLCNSLVWQAITGSHPPHPAPTSKQYTQAGLPWFEYYDERATAVSGAPTLSNMKSVAKMCGEKGSIALPENEPVTPDNVVVYRKGLKRGQVRECAF
jgi:hypothetical protein